MQQHDVKQIVHYATFSVRTHLLLFSTARENTKKVFIFPLNFFENQLEVTKVALCAEYSARCTDTSDKTFKGASLKIYKILVLYTYTYTWKANTIDVNYFG